MRRLSEAMRSCFLESLGEGGNVVEADEALFGDLSKAKRGKTRPSGMRRRRTHGGPANKRAVSAPACTRKSVIAEWEGLGEGLVRENASLRAEVLSIIQTMAWRWALLSLSG